MPKKKKDILFLCQFFYPDHNSSATLPFDTAEYLASQGFSVDALCGYPKEYSDDSNVPIKETKNGVNIHRIKYLQLNRTKRLGRLINYFSFSFSSALRLSKFKKYKCVIVYSNPPVLPFIAALANMLYKTNVIFVCYDVYPEVAYASDSLKEGGLIDRAMKIINDSVFKRASYVVALTDEMRDFIIEHRKQISPEKIVTISNWAHEETQSVHSENKTDFGYSSDDFIVSYFGNMGICQDVNTLLDTAKLLKNNDKIKFLISGHGSKKPFVEEFVKNNSLNNVRVTDFLLDDDLKNALDASSCSAVSLERDLKGMCAPSKYYSYLNASQAILVISQEDSYLAYEVKDNNLGFAVNIGESELLAEKISLLASNPDMLKNMQDNSLSLYKEKYSFKISMEKYKDLVTRVVQNNE